MTLEEIEVYLNAKHRLERNKAFALRDAREQVDKEIEKARKEILVIAVYVLHVTLQFLQQICTKITQDSCIYP